jgi:hypothetical protein
VNTEVEVDSEAEMNSEVEMIILEEEDSIGQPLSQEIKIMIFLLQEMNLNNSKMKLLDPTEVEGGEVVISEKTLIDHSKTIEMKILEEEDSMIGHIVEEVGLMSTEEIEEPSEVKILKEEIEVHQQNKK